MRTLIFSDLHLHNWSYGSTLEKGVNSRLLTQKNVLEQIYIYAKDNQIEQIVFCGDLFHLKGTVHEDVLKVAYEGFEKLSRVSSVVILVGNHDSNHRDLSTHTLHWLSGYCSVVDSPRTTGLQTFIPYTEDKHKLQKVLQNTPKDSYVYMHQGVVGTKLGSGFVIPNEILTPEMIPDHVIHAFTGHYHSHNRVSDRISIVGSPMQHDWSDRGDKRGWLLHESGRKITHMESVAPKFIQAYWDSNTDVDIGYLSSQSKGNFMRFVDVPEGDVSWIRNLCYSAKARSVEFVYTEKDKVIPNISKEESFDIDSVVEEYERGLNKSLRVMGEELRSKNYEIPQLKNK